MAVSSWVSIALSCQYSCVHICLLGDDVFYVVANPVGTPTFHPTSYITLGVRKAPASWPKIFPLPPPSEYFPCLGPLL